MAKEVEFSYLKEVTTLVRNTEHLEGIKNPYSQVEEAHRAHASYASLDK